MEYSMMKRTTLAIAVAGMAVSLTAADAAQLRHRHHHTGYRAHAQYTGAYPRPIYNGQDYLGNDPDPNIRFQIRRDLQTHYR
jgi:hypothetical protein